MTQSNKVAHAEATTVALPTSDHRDPLMRWLANLQQSHGWKTRGSRELEAVEAHLFRLAKCLDAGVRVSSDTEVDPGNAMLHLVEAGETEVRLEGDLATATHVEPPTALTLGDDAPDESGDLHDLRLHAHDLYEVYQAIPSRSRRGTAARAATLAQAIGAYARGNAEGPELWAEVERQEQAAFDRRVAFEAAVAAWHNKNPTGR